MNPVDEALQLLGGRGANESYGEGVTQRAHALQSAMLAQRAGAPEPLVAAALLHDVGHLLCGLPEDAAVHGVDDRHEEVGAAWLAARFGAAVAEPVRLHVEAKRFLVATQASYAAHLSPASVLSLELQGGPMSDEEQRRFRALPHAEDAVSLRRWDEFAKDPDARTPTLEDLRPLLDRVAAAS